MPKRVLACHPGRACRVRSDRNAGAGHTLVKYDFESTTVVDGDRPIVLTFGGDCETFDFSDPDNWLLVDADVWRFELPG